MPKVRIGADGADAEEAVSGKSAEAREVGTMRLTVKKHGVAAIPNLCGSCGKFRRWADLVTHFVPDSDYSSESESWRECKKCRRAKLKRWAAVAARRIER